MSKAGIQKFARILSNMQTARLELLQMGSKQSECSTPSGHQDILLGQLLEKAKDAVKDDFMRIINE